MRGSKSKESPDKKKPQEDKKGGEAETQITDPKVWNKKKVEPLEMERRASGSGSILMTRPDAKFVPGTSKDAPRVR